MLEAEFGESMRFELDSGQTKCVSEDVKTNGMSAANTPSSIPLMLTYLCLILISSLSRLPENISTVEVSSAYGHIYHIGDDVDSGNFAFTAAENGAYTACFLATNHRPPVRVTIDFVWKTGVAAKDWSMVAKKGQIMEQELKKLYETVTDIIEEMFYLRERYLVSDLRFNSIGSCDNVNVYSSKFYSNSGNKKCNILTGKRIRKWQHWVSAPLLYAYQWLVCRFGI
ncbi:hypothetical protein F3Y22_tig00110017pilonHSYRG00227 [Hibiscus syriacus]|uniref:GOLD domain-containing protein n=1 Tax=Hibiscus syriacus TaxID=106335 RepID=A0A6A3BPJ2_HIBSY|nr:hypothetical protein F3Y22_tig00110017pilonHSYRG00227 [Hibiscus syriacus]